MAIDIRTSLRFGIEEKIAHVTPILLDLNDVSSPFAVIVALDIECQILWKKLGVVN
jgi:hypothetical protein